eukprot:TRINITY_DN13879_c0_g5_i1.p1 TRINITY_DN13879_c0_g5~~TRINITY_DN13879_c0_g5_i1.p1  ORF type:complete len:1096 (-),score=284.42 TRINITY_DN13879_c0_g5_i1:206-3493(-)
MSVKVVVRVAPEWRCEDVSSKEAAAGQRAQERLPHHARLFQLPSCGPGSRVTAGRRAIQLGGNTAPAAGDAGGLLLDFDRVYLGDSGVSSVFGDGLGSLAQLVALGQSCSVIVLDAVGALGGVSGERGESPAVPAAAAAAASPLRTALSSSLRPEDARLEGRLGLGLALVWLAVQFLLAAGRCEGLGGGSVFLSWCSCGGGEPAARAAGDDLVDVLAELPARRQSAGNVPSSKKTDTRPQLEEGGVAIRGLTEVELQATRGLADVLQAAARTVSAVEQSVVSLSLDSGMQRPRGLLRFLLGTPGPQQRQRKPWHACLEPQSELSGAGETKAGMAQQLFGSCMAQRTLVVLSIPRAGGDGQATAEALAFGARLRECARARKAGCSVVSRDNKDEPEPEADAFCKFPGDAASLPSRDEPAAASSSIAGALCAEAVVQVEASQTADKVSMARDRVVSLAGHSEVAFQDSDWPECGSLTGLTIPCTASAVASLSSLAAHDFDLYDASHDTPLSLRVSPAASLPNMEQEDAEWSRLLSREHHATTELQRLGRPDSARKLRRSFSTPSVTAKSPAAKSGAASTVSWAPKRRYGYSDFAPKSLERAFSGAAAVPAKEAAVEARLRQMQNSHRQALRLVEAESHAKMLKAEAAAEAAAERRTLEMCRKAEVEAMRMLGTELLQEMAAQESAAEKRYRARFEEQLEDAREGLRAKDRAVLELQARARSSKAKEEEARQALHLAEQRLRTEAEEVRCLRERLDELLPQEVPADISHDLSSPPSAARVPPTPWSAHPVEYSRSSPEEAAASSQSRQALREPRRNTEREALRLFSNRQQRGPAAAAAASSPESAASQASSRARCWQPPSPSCSEPSSAAFTAVYLEASTSPASQPVRTPLSVGSRCETPNIRHSTTSAGRGSASASTSEPPSCRTHFLGSGSSGCSVATTSPTTGLVVPPAAYRTAAGPLPPTMPPKTWLADAQAPREEVQVPKEVHAEDEAAAQGGAEGMAPWELEELRCFLQGRFGSLELGVAAVCHAALQDGSPRPSCCDALSAGLYHTGFAEDIGAGCLAVATRLCRSLGLQGAADAASLSAVEMLCLLMQPP